MATLDRPLASRRPEEETRRSAQRPEAGRTATPGGRLALEEWVREILDDIAANRDDAVRRTAAVSTGRRATRCVSPTTPSGAIKRGLPETFREDFAYAHVKVASFAQARGSPRRSSRPRSNPA
jgi:hypothetical protein